MTDDALATLITRVHARSCPLVVGVTGGGSGAIAQLLRVPGASRTVLEAGVYYAAESLSGWLGGQPEQFCSSRTARAMAMVAWQNARRLTVDRQPHPSVLGVSCTASLASDRPKRGDHRAHLAWQSSATTVAVEILLEKGQRHRGEEEDLIAALLLAMIDGATADVAGESPSSGWTESRLAALRTTLRLHPAEQLQMTRQDAPGEWQALLLGQTAAAGRGQGTRSPADSQPRTIFPGAFNPHHRGHQAMAEVAGRRTNRPVEYEISVTNVEKPPLDYLEMAWRQKQFAPDESLWFTRAPTFVEKSRIFPGSTFVVGADTIVRIGELRFYAGSTPAAQEASRDDAIKAIADQGCRFLVFGRRKGPEFQSLETVPIPEALRSLCSGVPESEFRQDVSSTELRGKSADTKSQ